MVLSCFKALSDPTRLRLVHLLMKYELSVNELVHVLEMGQSRISRHLKILSDAGLLTSRRNGLWVFYRGAESGKAGDLLNALDSFMPRDECSLRDRNRAAAIMAERDQRSRTFFNAVAENWDELNHEILGDFDIPSQVAARMPANCRTAVDLGCGTGAVLQRMLAKSENVIGVDDASGMLAHCRGRLSTSARLPDNLSLRIGELSHLPLRDHEADFASVNLVLHHLADPAAGLAEIHRILSPGGSLFISDFLLHDNESMRTRYGDQWLGFEEGRLLRMLELAGFRVGEISRAQVGNGLTLLMITATTKEMS